MNHSASDVKVQLRRPLRHNTTDAEQQVGHSEERNCIREQQWMRYDLALTTPLPAALTI